MPCGELRKSWVVADIDVQLAGEPPVDVHDLPLDLFRRPDFYALHRDAAPRAWYAVARDRETNAPLAAGWLSEVEPGHARSPGRGSYGGLQLVDARTPVSTLDAIASELERTLAREGIERLTIVMPPAAYAPNEHALWTNVLMRGGYQPGSPDLSYAVDVTDGPLDARMNSGNRYIARTAERRGLAFRVLGASERCEAYAVNAENKAKRGYPMTMSLDALIAMDDALPGRVLWFGVMHDGRMIAANVSLVISPGVIYVFYWGEVRGVEKLSPVTVLADGVYRHCQSTGVRLLDLGTATLHGEPNPGLMAYKQNLGGTASLKLTLSKELN
jgi:hypothetical protein